MKKHDGFLLSCYKHKSTYKENKYANMEVTIYLLMFFLLCDDLKDKYYFFF